jgi:molybdopterin-guanine dinucleotide biosynthesis protein
MNISKVLSEMDERIKVAFPEGYPEHTIPRVVIHHKDREQGKRERNEYDSIVSMTFDTFLELLKSYTNDNKNTKRVT